MSLEALPGRCQKASAKESATYPRVIVASRLGRRMERRSVQALPRATGWSPAVRGAAAVVGCATVIVAVDARNLHAGRGVARVTRSTLGALARGYPADEWRLVVPGREPVDAPAGDNVVVLRSRAPSRVLHGTAALAGRPRLARLAGSRGRRRLGARAGAGGRRRRPLRADRARSVVGGAPARLHPLRAPVAPRRPPPPSRGGRRARRGGLLGHARPAPDPVGARARPGPRRPQRRRSSRRRPPRTAGRRAPALRAVRRSARAAQGARAAAGGPRARPRARARRGPRHRRRGSPRRKR